MTGHILYTSPFIPPEWIAAHGLRPGRAIPAGAAPSAPAGVCTFAAAFSLAVSNVADAVVMTTTCDQMRRMAETVAGSMGQGRTFLFNMPATWQTPGVLQLYRDELERLSRFLVNLGGLRPAARRLAETMRRYDELRQSVRGFRAFMSGREFARAIAGAGAGTQMDSSSNTRARAGKPIALLGGPLRQSDWWIYDEIERHGGHIALDATEAGERTLPAPFNPATLPAEPLNELVRTYFQTIPDAFRRPDTMLYDYLERMLKERRIGGIILVRSLWCDLWHAQLQPLREATGLPVIEIDMGGEDHDLQRTRNRIEALLDVVS